MTLTAVILLVLKISIMLNVLSLGLRAAPEDATYLFRHPRELARAFLSMNVIMPAVALGLSLAFALKPAVEIALIVISVSPVPPVFPRKALKEGGRQEYVIGLLVAAAVLAIAVIPITMEIVGRLLEVPLQMPARSVAVLVLSTILAPLTVGIVVNWLAPALAGHVAKPLGLLSTVLLVASALPVFAGSFQGILSLNGDGTLLSIAVFALTGCIVGHLLGGPSGENSRVLSSATASRHPGIAAAIAQVNFPEQKLVLPAIALYLIVSGIVSALFSAAVYAKSSPPEKSAPARPVA